MYNPTEDEFENIDWDNLVEEPISDEELIVMQSPDIGDGYIQPPDHHGHGWWGPGRGGFAPGTGPDDEIISDEDALSDPISDLEEILDDALEGAMENIIEDLPWDPVEDADDGLGRIAIDIDKDDLEWTEDEGQQEYEQGDYGGWDVDTEYSNIVAEFLPDTWLDSDDAAATSDEDWWNKFGMYFQEYDRTQENYAKKARSAQIENWQHEMNKKKMELELNSGASGFVSRGADQRYLDIVQEVGNMQYLGDQMDYHSDIFNMRTDYNDSIYQTIGMLAEMDAFEGGHFTNEGGGDVSVGEDIIDAVVEDDGEAILDAVDHADGGSGDASNLITDNVDGTPGSCFHPDTTVEYEDGSIKPVKEIKYGDKIKAVDKKGNIIYSEVWEDLYFNNKDVQTPNYYITIKSGNKTIKLTSMHTVFVNKIKPGFLGMRNLQAKNVKPGMTINVISDSGDKIETRAVDSVTHSMDRGMYDIFTKEGTVVASGIVAGTLAFHKHKYAQFWHKYLNKHPRLYKTIFTYIFMPLMKVLGNSKGSIYRYDDKFKTGVTNG